MERKNIGLLGLLFNNKDRLLNHSAPMMDAMVFTGGSRAKGSKLYRPEKQGKDYGVGFCGGKQECERRRRQMQKTKTAR